MKNKNALTGVWRVEDGTDYVPSLGNNGGRYMYYYILAPKDEGWYVLESWSSCDFADDRRERELTAAAAAEFLESSAADALRGGRITFFRDGQEVVPTADGGWVLA